MINNLMKAYSQYNMRYDIADKILFIYTPMIMEDFIKLKNMIINYELDIKEIRIKGGI